MIFHYENVEQKRPAKISDFLLRFFQRDGAIKSIQIEIEILFITLKSLSAIK